MKYFHIALLIFVIYIHPINGQEIQQICPTGKSSTQDCDSRNPCTLGSICYRKINKNVCCGDVDTFCPTKMHAINNNEDETYLWGPSEATGKENWYNVSLGNETIACPIPHSFTYTEYTELKVLPADFEISEKSKPKACKLNSDCHVDKDEFCGASFHPTYPGQLDRSGPNGSPLRFCYKAQSFGTNVTIIINATNIELTGCDNHSECIQDGGAQSFCFIMDVSKPFQIADNKGMITSKKGFCSMAHVCDPEKHVSIVGTLSKTNSFCQTNEDCEGSENAIQNPGNNSECISIPKIKGAKLCCSRKYDDSKVCQVGKLERPTKTCSNFEDCNRDKNDTILKKWCDEQIKHCCHDEAKELWSCPDGATPIYNEPKCEDVSPIDVESGKCSQDGGICRYGHCCPQLMRKNETEFSMALKQYITNIACKSDEPVPEHFNYAFCDPDSMNMVILGTLTVDGQEIGTDGERCSTNKECEENEVCIKRIKDDRFCIWNPLKEYIYSNLWWYMLAASIVGVFVFAALSVRFYIYYRRSKIHKQDSPPKMTAKPVTPPKVVKKEERVEKKPDKSAKNKKTKKRGHREREDKQDYGRRSGKKGERKAVDNPNAPYLPFDKTVYENINSPVVHDRVLDAAAKGLVVDPRHTKYMGNTDIAVEREREEHLKEYQEEEFKDHEAPTPIEKENQKVRICEDKCVLFETNDAPTVDDDKKEEEKEDDDIL